MQHIHVGIVGCIFSPLLRCGSFRYLSLFYMKPLSVSPKTWAVETKYSKGNPNTRTISPKGKGLVDFRKSTVKTIENNYKLRFSPIVNIS